MTLNHKKEVKNQTSFFLFSYNLKLKFHYWSNFTTLSGFKEICLFKSEPFSNKVCRKAS